MIAHLGFIVVAYALAIAVIGGMTAAILLDYRRLRRDLSRFEERDAERIDP